MKKSLLLLLLVLSLWCCQARHASVLAPLEEEGELFVYLQPFPQEAAGVQLTLANIAAVTIGAGETPLSLVINKMSGLEKKRQRLLAWGRLAPGSYRGLTVSLERAQEKSEEGEVSSSESSEIHVDVPFSVSRRRSTVLYLTVDYRPATAEGSGLAFSLSAFVPRKPLAGLVGYVSNSSSHNITVFNKRSGEVQDVIATGREPQGIALDRRLSRAYVALSGDDAVEVIDLAQGEPFFRIRLLRGDSSRALSLTTDGKTLLAVNNGSNSVSIIDTTSLAEVNRIRVGSGPNSLVVDRSGKRGYVFNTYSNTISVIDVQNQSIVATLSSDAAPIDGDISARGDKLYVIHQWSPYLLVIDLQTLAVRDRIFIGSGAECIKVNPSTDLFYVGKRLEGVVEVYSPNTRLPIDVITSPGAVRHIAIDGEENTLYFLSPAKRRLTDLGVINRQAIFEIDTGEDPYWVSVMGER